MLDLGLVEIAFVAILALVVIGPKDLPRFIRIISGAMRKLRRYYQDVTNTMHKLEREMSLAQVRPDGTPDYFDMMPEHVRERSLQQSAAQPESEPSTTQETPEPVAPAAIKEVIPGTSTIAEHADDQQDFATPETIQATAEKRPHE